MFSRLSYGQERYFFLIPILIIVMSNGDEVGAKSIKTKLGTSSSQISGAKLPTKIPVALSPIPEKFQITQFKFIGNTVFSDEELAKATTYFTKKSLTFTELLQVEVAIRNKYIQAGYINSDAVITANQNIQNGVVEIQIIEGSIEDIQVTGTQRLNKSYIINRLKLATQKPFNTQKLLRGLQLLQLNPLIKNITANLSSGSRPDQSLLLIEIIENDSFNITAFVDNGRAPSVGTWRRGIQISEGNVSGLGDSLNVTYTNTDGSNALDVSYVLPFNPENGAIRLAGGFTKTNVIEPPFDRLDITGDSSYYEIGLSHPLFQTASDELSLGITLSHQQSKTKLFAEGFPLSRGANDNGETRISAIRLFQNWTKRNSQEILAIYSQFNIGIGLFDATTNSQLPDSHFFSWRGQGQYVRSLNKERDMLFVLRSDLQFATESLVPLEQFSIGGLASVRGYRQDTLLTDNGIITTAEFRFPVWRVSDVKGVLSVIPFVDFGVGWNSSDLPKLDTNTLIGVGLGLQWQMGEQFKARVDWGIPLNNVKSQDRTLQENGLYFSLESRL